MDEKTNLPLDNEEPSVLDYFKSLLTFWRGNIPEIPELPVEPDKVKVRPAHQARDESSSLEAFPPVPWRIILILLLVLFNQIVVVDRFRNIWIALFIYLVILGLALWSLLDGELSLPKQEEVEAAEEEVTFRPVYLGVGAAISLIAYVAFGGNRFTSFNVMFWAVGFGFILAAFWQTKVGFRGWVDKIKNLFQQEGWQPRITRWTLALALVLAISIFFRVHHMGAVVPEMVSDQAEKLWDVVDILNGKTSIFFTRNTGREPLQFYLITATIKLFNTGVSFLSMKIGTVFLGILMLPYMYLLGKELGNRWVGLFAMLLAGIAFWPNILARVALRFILYPAFTAPVLYHLVRGLRTSSRNQFILAGIFLGFGLHGYTPYRAVPVLVVVTIFLYLAHNFSVRQAKRVFIWLFLVAFISLIIFLPLLRYMFEDPTMFNYRMMSRINEQPIPGPPLLVLFSNIWKGLLMMNYDSGNIWVITQTGKPNLDMISGALFVLGAGLVLIQYLRDWKWERLFLLLAVPILMLPSTLVLAFPNENPAPNRAGGAMVPVFILAAIALEAVLRGVKETLGERGGKGLAWGIGLFLLFIAAFQNYAMTFEVFPPYYDERAWNTSELGAVIENFADTVGDRDSAWVVAYPHWVDTRLVGINAGFPEKDYAIWPDEIVNTLEIIGPKLFLFRLDDPDAMSALLELYPNGSLDTFESRIPSKNFYIYFVPPENP